jgi:hypothetical protein
LIGYATEKYVDDAIGDIEIPESTEKISGTVTTAVGGIAKDKSYNNATVAEVLTDLLFPYVAPALNSISTSESSGTFEYGTTRTISRVTPNFTKGSKNITSIKIGTTSGGSDLYSGTTATSGSAIMLTKAKTFDGTTGGTIYCTISDGTSTDDASTPVRYAYYTYYAVTDSTSTPASWSPVGSTSVTGITVTANAGQYVWIASTGNYTGICELNELSGKYNTASETTKITSQTLVNSKNYTCTNKYNFYRLSSARSGTGTATFELQ